MVGKFVKWDNTIIGRNNPTDDEILKSFNFTRYMKLLYFTCLASVNLTEEEEEEEEEDRKIITKMGLFSTFDSFWAYENGPVETHVYSNRSFLFNYEFKNGVLETLKDKTDSFEQSRIKIYKKNITSTYVTDTVLIDKSIEWLINQGQAFPMTDTKALVDLSHSLKLWKDAIFLQNPILDINISNLKEEKELFEHELQAS